MNNSDFTELEKYNLKLVFPSNIDQFKVMM